MGGSFKTELNVRPLQHLPAVVVVAAAGSAPLAPSEVYQPLTYKKNTKLARLYTGKNNVVDNIVS